MNTQRPENDPRTPMQRKLDAAKQYLREMGRARPGVLERWMRERGHK